MKSVTALYSVANSLRLFGCVILATTAASLFFSGCESHPRRGAHGGESGLAAPIPAMEAEGNFFSGKIVAEIHLGRSDLPWRNKGGQENTGDGSGRGEGRGGFGGGHRRRGGAGGEGVDFGEGRGGRGGSGEDGPAPQIRASNAPPVQLRLRLTNHGDTTASVEVLDFDSILGNFAVQPAKIIVPAGQTVEADPMISRLGVPGGEIPVNLRLRVNGNDQDRQTLTLKVVPVPPPSENLPPKMDGPS